MPACGPRLEAGLKSPSSAVPIERNVLRKNKKLAVLAAAVTLAAGGGLAAVTAGGASAAGPTCNLKLRLTDAANGSHGTDEVSVTGAVRVDQELDLVTTELLPQSSGADGACTRSASFRAQWYVVDAGGTVVKVLTFDGVRDNENAADRADTSFNVDRFDVLGTWLFVRKGAYMRPGVAATQVPATSPFFARLRTKVATFPTRLGDDVYLQGRVTKYSQVGDHYNNAGANRQVRVLRLVASSGEWVTTGPTLTTDANGRVTFHFVNDELRRYRLWVLDKPGGPGKPAWGVVGAPVVK